MKNYEVRIYLKKHNETKIIIATTVILTKTKVQIVDYSTGEILFYNKDDVKIEYIKEEE